VCYKATLTIVVRSVGGKWISEHRALVKQWRQRRTEVLRQNPVSDPLCLELNPGIRGPSSATNRLGHGANGSGEHYRFLLFLVLQFVIATWRTCEFKRWELRFYHHVRGNYGRQRRRRWWRVLLNTASTINNVTAAVRASTSSRNATVQRAFLEHVCCAALQSFVFRAPAYEP